MAYEVVLPATDPKEEGLVAFVRENGITMVKIPESYGPPFEEFTFSHDDPLVLRALIREHWGDEDLYAFIEEVKS
jgi:hypothetical protein